MKVEWPLQGIRTSVDSTQQKRFPCRAVKSTSWWNYRALHHFRVLVARQECLLGQESPWEAGSTFKLKLKSQVIEVHPALSESLRKSWLVTKRHKYSKPPYWTMIHSQFLSHKFLISFSTARLAQVSLAQVSPTLTTYDRLHKIHASQSS